MLSVISQVKSENDRLYTNFTPILRYRRTVFFFFFYRPLTQQITYRLETKHNA